MPGRDFDRRLERIERVLGDPRCTCTGPGLETIELSPGQPVPENDEPPERCPAHGVPAAGTLRVFVPGQRRRAPSGLPSGGSGTERFATLLPGGRLLVNLPGPETLEEA